MEIFDPILVICLINIAGWIMGTHYFVRHYNLWCPDKRRTMEIKIIGRYITGMLSTATGFVGWCVTHPDWTVPDALVVFLLCVFTAGAATVLFYLIDGILEGRACEDDLTSIGLGTK